MQVKDSGKKILNKLLNKNKKFKLSWKYMQLCLPLKNQPVVKLRCFLILSYFSFINQEIQANSAMRTMSQEQTPAIKY